MKISFVLPVFNEEALLKDFFTELQQEVQSLAQQIDYVFINDGSSDRSLDIILGFKSILKSNEQLKVIDFSRNFGHQAAVTAGVSEAQGDAIVIMDTDLQDDPKAISKFVDQWKQGFEVVYAVRSQRQENFVLRALFKTYYQIFSRVSRVPMPHDAGNFGLIDQRVANQIRALPEHHRYFPGLRAWVGYKQTGISVPRRSRKDGQAKVGVIGLFRLALDGIVSFSDFPLRLAFLISVLLSFLGILGVFLIVGIKLFTDKAVIMWASIMCSVIFIGAGQFFLIGLLGEYIGRVYSEVKRRPHYIIREIL